MSYLGTSVEYALHCLTWLACPLEQPPSSHDLADMQGVPPAYMKKIFPKLEKAGIVTATVGIRGGYRLARPTDQITVLDVVDAVEGRKPLFDCQEIRGRCAIFDGKPPEWSSRGVCAIHAVMIRAEKAMRDEMAKTSLAGLMGVVVNKVQPDGFADQVRDWFAGRQTAREDARVSAMRARGTTKPDEGTA